MAEHGTTTNYRRGCRCDECRAAKSEAARKYHETNPDVVRATRRQSRVKRRKEHLEYNLKWAKANRDRVNEGRRRWLAASPDHRDKVRESTRKYRAANMEKKREHDRKYREANLDKVRESSRKWAESNRDKMQEYKRLWREANPDKVREERYARRARKLAAFVEGVDPWKVFERDGWVCHICGDLIDPALKGMHPRAASLDHVIPLAKGGEHSYDNCATSHLGCNARKGAKLTG